MMLSPTKEVQNNFQGKAVKKLDTKSDTGKNVGLKSEGILAG